MKSLVFKKNNQFKAVFRRYQPRKFLLPLSPAFAVLGRKVLETAQRLLALHVLTNELIVQTVALSLEEVQALSLKMES